MSAYDTSVLADTPFAYWIMSDASGNPADSSGNARPLTANATLVYGEPSLVASDPAGCIKFTTGYCQMGNFWTDLGATFTLETWLKRSDLTSQSTIFGPNGSPGPLLRFPTSSNSIDWFSSSSGTKVTWANTITDTTTPHHLVMTWINATKVAELWVDDVSLGQLTAAQALSGSTDIQVGGNVGADKFKGWMGHAALYAAGLSSARIAAHYNAALVTTHRKSMVLS